MKCKTCGKRQAPPGYDVCEICTLDVFYKTRNKPKSEGNIMGRDSAAKYVASWAGQFVPMKGWRNVKTVRMRRRRKMKFKKGEVIAVRESEDPKAYWRYDTFQGMTEYGLYKTSLFRYPFARNLNAEEKGE